LSADKVLDFAINICSDTIDYASLARRLICPNAVKTGPCSPRRGGILPETEGNGLRIFET
jgi:hypothetical protein